MREKLNKYKNKKFYKVPENYFEELPSIIQNRVQDKEGNHSFFSGTYALKVAIPTILLLIVIYFVVPIGSTSEENTFFELSANEVVTYFDNNGYNASYLLEEISDQVNEDNLLKEFTFEEEYALQEKNLQKFDWIEEDYYELYPM